MALRPGGRMLTPGVCAERVSRFATSPGLFLSDDACEHTGGLKSGDPVTVVYLSDLAIRSARCSHLLRSGSFHRRIEPG